MLKPTSFLNESPMMFKSNQPSLLKPNLSPANDLYQMNRGKSKILLCIINSYR